MQVCIKCKIEKPWGDFYKRAKLKSGKPNPTGHRSECKECERTRYADYRIKNKDKIKKQRLEYCKANRKKLCEKTKAYNKKQQALDPLWNIKNNLRNLYRITLDDYYELLKSQDNKCAICLSPPKDTRKGRLLLMCVDHVKGTKPPQLRGILCKHCNSGIGQLKHDVNLIQASIDYLNNNLSHSHKISYIPNHTKLEIIRQLQQHLCKICKQPETTKHHYNNSSILKVDHDHKSGLVRGALCSNCNVALGLFNDSPALLQQAIKYLQRFQNKFPN